MSRKPTAKELHSQAVAWASRKTREAVSNSATNRLTIERMAYSYEEGYRAALNDIREEMSIAGASLHEWVEPIKDGDT